MQRIEDVKLEVDYVTALIKIRTVILDFLYPEEKTEVPVMLHYLQNGSFHSAWLKKPRRPKVNHKDKMRS